MKIEQAIKSGKRHRRKTMRLWFPAVKKVAYAFSHPHPDWEFVDSNEYCLFKVHAAYSPDDVMADDWELEE